MPQAVTHILIPLILMALIRDFYLRESKGRHKRSFPLHYVLIAGLAGLLPDIDIAIFGIINFLKAVPLLSIHRTFTHSIFFPLIFLLLYVIFAVWKDFHIPILRKHKLKVSIILLMIFFGSFMHISLDFILNGVISPLYPFYNITIGLNLISYLPSHIQKIFIPSLDALLLFFWLIYLELKHKISDVV